VIWVPQQNRSLRRKGAEFGGGQRRQGWAVPGRAVRFNASGSDGPNLLKSIGFSIRKMFEFCRPRLIFKMNGRNKNMKNDHLYIYIYIHPLYVPPFILANFTPICHHLSWSYPKTEYIPAGLSHSWLDTFSRHEIIFRSTLLPQIVKPALLRESTWFHLMCSSDTSWQKVGDVQILGGKCFFLFMPVYSWHYGKILWLLHSNVFAL